MWLDVVKVGLPAATLLIGLPGGLFLVYRAMCLRIERRIDEAEQRVIGHIKAAGLAHAALSDEFGSPPGVAAGVQVGRHRELRLVGSKRPGPRRVLARMYRLAVG